MASNNNGYNIPAHLDADREELTYPRETEHDHYTEDTNADPEGSEARDTNRRNTWPAFVLENFYEDTKNLWGKANKNDESLLRPSLSHINECIAQTAISDDDDLALAKLASGEQDQIDSLIAGYKLILDSQDGNGQFEIMRTVGNITTKHLARRAIAKATYFAATGRMTESQEAQPEWLDKMQDRMFVAATNAGLWRQVHQELWSHVGWKKSPVYYVDNEIRSELHQKAQYFQKNYAPVKPTATAADYAKMNIAC